jgi:hypothetical protein
VNVNGIDTRATGGTWEFIGNVIVGAAATRAIQRKVPHTAFVVESLAVCQISPAIQPDTISDDNALEAQSL